MKVSQQEPGQKNAGECPSGTLPMAPEAAVQTPCPTVACFFTVSLECDDEGDLGDDGDKDNNCHS